MGELTILQRLKEWISKWSFKLFLWSSDMTKDEYINAVYQQELNFHNNKTNKS